jgi:hypothetical protein
MVRTREIQIPDSLITTDSTQNAYRNPVVLNHKGPDYKRPAVIKQTYEDGPLTTNDLLDLLPFQQFTINNDDEIVSTVPVSEFNLSHLEPDKRHIVMRQLYEFEHSNLFSNKEGNLGLAVDVKHFINTRDNPPVSMRTRRTPEALKSTVWDTLRNM